MVHVPFAYYLHAKLYALPDQLGIVQVPKPPKKDFYKLMNKDKIVLRFSTRFVETPTHQLSSSDRSGLSQPDCHVFRRGQGVHAEGLLLEPAVPTALGPVYIAS